MKRKTCERTDVQIAYIGGGSKEWAWKLMTDLAMEPQLSGTVRLYDIDRPAAEKNAAIGNSSPPGTIRPESGSIL